ncbi:MAG: S41 family peptidase [Myxococcota bacterium]|nr:S41 family peptidase [Myxococcota bacterium]
MSVFVLLFSVCAWGAGPKTDPVDPMYGRMVRLIEDRYLRLDEFDPAAAFVAAAEEAEGAIPWLIVEPTGAASVTLQDVSAGHTVSVHFGPSDEAPTIDALPDALHRIENAIDGFETEYDDRTEVAVVLMKGVASTLDRHSVVMAKRKLERFDERIKGKLTGIGAKLRVVDGVLRVQEVFPETPSERGGLRVEDAIRRVDGVSTLGMDIQQAVDRIRGPKGSDVVLTIERRESDGSDSVNEMVFTRDEVNIPNVSWSLSESGVGTIRIEHFSEHTSKLTLTALESFRMRAAEGHPFRGLVLDLRNNSGGSLIQSAETVDLFVAAGEIVQTSGRRGAVVPNLVRSLSAYPAASPAEEPDVPMVVLQNQKSASASEIVAGALSALDRAIVIGRTSFGKGTVQKLYTLRGGQNRVRFKLTVAEYKLHGGQMVHGEGIPTDVTQRRVVFNGSGAWVPAVADSDVPVIVDVDERTGWRTEGEVDLERDPLAELGHELVLRMAGPTRDDGLEAIEEMEASIRNDASARVSETFRLRQIDWRPTSDSPGILDAAVGIEVVGDAVAGQQVTVRAEVANNGPAPLYQTRVRLLTESRRGPFHGTTIPVGFIPPGEAATGEVIVSIRTSSPDRSDDVKLRLEADGLDSVDMDPVQLDVASQPPPPLSADIRLVPDGDHHRLEVELSNDGEHHLTGVLVKLGWREDSGIELLDREGRLVTLEAGQSGRVDLGVRVLEEAASEIPIQLTVGAERFPLLMRVPISVPRDGSAVHVEEPRILAKMATRSRKPTVTVPIVAEDDGGLDHLTVWWHGEKVAWVGGDGDRLETTVELALSDGSNALTIVASDVEGNQTRTHRYIWGALPDQDGSSK